MNRDLIRKWVDALRSGEYEQCTGALNAGGRYCCLGVACEIAIQNGAKVEKVPFDGVPGTYLYNGMPGVLPLAAANAYGFTSYNPEVEWNGDSRALSSLNDFERLSFSEIADLIEATWLTEKEPVPA